MQRIADMILRTDEDGNVLKIVWECRRLEKVYTEKWSGFTGQKISDVFQGETDAEEGTLYWEKEKFLYLRLKCTEGREVYLLKKAESKEFLYEEALNCIHEGIQIYDENGDVIFLNSCSRKISSIPADEEVEGQNLFDLYNYSREISTVMTSLKIKAPVINRIWSFQTATGKNIRTANSAYPVFKDGELIGSVAFEQDVNIAGRYISEMESIRKSLEEIEASGDSSGNFSGYSFNHIIGKGEKLQSAVRLAKKVAPRECTVLLNGETGTGKEIFAQSVHNQSRRKNEAFIAVNCAALPENLLETELFGYDEGAFTGGRKGGKKGLFELANHGTLFLDEIGELSPALQSRLLRVLQEKEIMHVGGERIIPVDVRIIAATNKRLEEMDEAAFRRDLLYRLNVLMLVIPPLRERETDVIELFNFFYKKKSDVSIGQIELTDEVREILMLYHWPGNIRELQNVCERFCLYLKQSARYNDALLKKCMIRAVGEENLKKNILDLYDYEEKGVSAEVVGAFKRIFSYNREQIAKLLGVSRTTIWRLTKEEGKETT